jgi:hypothetical protein
MTSMHSNVLASHSRRKDKRQRTAALQDAKRLPVTHGTREASWSAAALRRFRLETIEATDTLNRAPATFHYA